MYLSPPRQARQERIPAAIAALGAVGLVGWALLSGLSVSAVVQAVAPLVSVDLTTPPRPPEPPRERPKPVHRSAAREAPSPRNLRNKATQVVAPILPPLITPPPIVAAPRPGTGSASNNGASDRAGPGQGAGGEGNGTGGGGDGGDGDGDIAPEQIAGQLKLSDLPPELARTLTGADVEVRYYVNTDGRASDCRVTASSGYSAVDAAGCQAVEQRFRFRPSRDGSGRPVRSIMVQKLNWTIDRSQMARERG